MENHLRQDQAKISRSPHRTYSLNTIQILNFREPKRQKQIRSYLTENLRLGIFERKRRPIPDSEISNLNFRAPTLPLIFIRILFIIKFSFYYVKSRRHTLCLSRDAARRCPGTRLSALLVQEGTRLAPLTNLMTPTIFRQHRVSFQWRSPKRFYRPMPIIGIVRHTNRPEHFPNNINRV